MSFAKTAWIYSFMCWICIVWGIPTARGITDYSQNIFEANSRSVGSSRRMQRMQINFAKQLFNGLQFRYLCCQLALSLFVMTAIFRALRGDRSPLALKYDVCNGWYGVCLPTIIGNKFSCFCILRYIIFFMPNSDWEEFHISFRCRTPSLLFLTH